MPTSDVRKKTKTTRTLTETHCLYKNQGLGYIREGPLRQSILYGFLRVGDTILEIVASDILLAFFRFITLTRSEGRSTQLRKCR